MLYPVRILNPKGKLQKVLNSEQLSRNFWKCFREEEGKMGFRAENTAKKLKQLKKQNSKGYKPTQL